MPKGTPYNGVTLKVNNQNSVVSKNQEMSTALMLTTVQETGREGGYRLL